MRCDVPEPNVQRPARFTGREDAIAAVLHRLHDGRLVTITGCGGIGKTSLATEVLRRIEDGPAAWVDLSMVTDGAELAPLLARTLKIGEQSTRSPAEQVERYLRTRPGTLVLDNCEHVIGAVTDLTGRLLDVCPGLRVLATSTEPLRLPDEVIYDLPPLDLPDPAQPLEDVRQSECVRLLIQRVRQVVPDFDVTEANRTEVVELCRRLDGLPLAIELAATRLRVLSVAQLIERLDQRFSVLTGGSSRAPKRHQTLRALVEWSLERCSPEERLLWGRLSVFPGSFRLETAEQICGFGDLARERVLDVLTGLVTRSLIVVERAGDRVRYRQLATVRDYGHELLARSGEDAEVRRRLLRHYLTDTRRQVRDWCGPDQGLALATWRDDHAAMLGAVAWAVTQPQHHDEAAELVTLLRYHWIAGGQLSDGRRWLDHVLSLSGLSLVRRGHALAAVAWVALIQGDPDTALNYLHQANEIALRIDDVLLGAYVDAWLGLRDLFAGDLTDAITRYRRATTVFEQNAELGAALTARFQLAMAQTMAGDHAAALESCATAIEIIHVPHGDRPHPVVLYLHGGGFVAGSLDVVDEPAKDLAERTGALVVTATYRRAPEHKFPAAHDDAYAALTWVRDNIAKSGGDPDRIVLAGDSAGGNLAGAAAVRAAQEGLDLAGLLLIYPLVSPVADTPSRLEYAAGYVIEQADLEWFGAQYLNSPDEVADPRLALDRADLSGLPPTLVLTNEFDTVRDEGEQLADLIDAAGGEAEAVRFSGLAHGTFWMSGAVFRAEEQRATAAQFVRDQVAAAVRIAVPA